MIESDYLRDNISYVERLGKMPSLADFSEKDLKGILELSKIRKYEPGEVILDEGVFDSWIYFLISGKIKVIKHDESLSILRRTGDVFGEMGIIDGSYHFRIICRYMRHQSAWQLMPHISTDYPEMIRLPFPVSCTEFFPRCLRIVCD